MQRVILVVSPDTEFLHQIRSHLEEGGRYQVTAALNAHEALTLANSNFFEVAILDGELDDIPVSAFTRDLSALQSELKILVFPPDNNPHHPVLEGMIANGLLSKPFSGQEIGKALSSLFSDQPVAGNIHVKVIDDLVKQWLQIPETGGRKAEQILEATTAQTVLIISKDQLIASAGSVGIDMVRNVTGFLARYWREEENSELARFFKLDGDGSDRFLYATRLVSNVVLVLIYPMNTTIQLVRHELNKVKDDFQRHYPTTGELRQDIANQTLADINLRNKKIENLQPDNTSFSQAELDARSLFEQESQKSRPRPVIDAISQAEIDALKALEEESSNSTSDTVSQAELDARKLFEQESLKSRPKLADLTISQAEIDALKALEQESSNQTATTVSQAELDARKLFEQESLKSKPKPADLTISQAEIDALKALEQESSNQTATNVSQAELDARKLFEQESLKSKPKPADLTISQAEIDALKALEQEPSNPPAETVSQAELDARKLFEQESLKSKPKPADLTISQAEIDTLKALEQEPSNPPAETVSQAELNARRLFEQESLKQKPADNGISQAEIDLLKDTQSPTPQTPSNGVSQVELDALQLFHQESMKPSPVTAPVVDEQELENLTKMLEQMPAPDPNIEGDGSDNTQLPEEDKKLPEWLNELENVEAKPESLSTMPLTATESTSNDTPPFVGIDETITASAEENTTNNNVSTSTETPEPLPEVNFKLPWEMEEPTAEALVETVAEQAVESIVQPEADQSIPPPLPVTETPADDQVSPASTFAEVLNAVTPQEEVPSASEPSAEIVEEPASIAAPNVKDFRFIYTCVLIPGNRNQFLARSLSEKIGNIMPDIHEDQGWHMTSITIRPQYLLWTVAVPMGICPHKIIGEVRNLTSNSIFANFPDIAEAKTSDDFWSTNFLAVSGSEPPPANLIIDFVAQAWKNPETNTP